MYKKRDEEETVNFNRVEFTIGSLPNFEFIQS